MEFGKGEEKGYLKNQADHAFLTVPGGPLWPTEGLVLPFPLLPENHKGGQCGCGRINLWLSS